MSLDFKYHQAELSLEDHPTGNGWILQIRADDSLEINFHIDNETLVDLKNLIDRALLS